jgi:hypothetical protein
MPRGKHHHLSGRLDYPCVIRTARRRFARSQTFRAEADRRIERLIARKRKGGADFFTSQIIIQENRSGSGTYDLRLFHGLSGRHTKFRTITPWGCDADDYPIAYFIGFRVDEIQNAQILVSREKDVVNVISLKKLDANLSKRISVRMFKDGRVLCADIGVGCIDSILFNRYES